MTAANAERLSVLDGWRALSIVSVLAAHLLPLNALVPRSNEAAGLFGMAVFFTLSGFLITRFLIERPDPRAFIIRRAFRILPLAWVGVMAAFVIDGAGKTAMLAPNLLFYANLPPIPLFDSGAHLWSLNVEVQFYVVIALAIAVFGNKALYALPVFGVAVTALRVATGSHISIVTWLRIDEILAGALVALIWSGWFGARAKTILTGTNTWLAVIIALAACYFANTPPRLSAPLCCRADGRLDAGRGTRDPCHPAAIACRRLYRHGFLCALRLPRAARLDLARQRRRSRKIS